MAQRLIEVMLIPLSSVRPPKFGLRKNLGDPEELKASMREKGLLEPILVRPVDGHYETVLGDRRRMAAIELGWKEIEAKVRELEDKEAFEIALTENIQRKSMEWDEEGRAFARYVGENGWGSQNDLARMIGKSVGYVSERIAVSKASPEIFHAVKSEQLTLSHAEALTTLPGDKAAELSEKVIDVGLDSDQTRKAAGFVKRGLSVDQAVQTVLNFPDWSVPESRPAYDAMAMAREQIVMSLRQALTNVDTSILAMPEGRERSKWTRDVRYPLHNLIDASNALMKEARKR